MGNIKKIIIALGISIVIYGISSYVYNEYIKEPYQSMYVLTRDLAKNEVLKEEYLKEIKTSNIIGNKEYLSKSDLFSKKDIIVSAYSIRAGQIMTKDVITKKQELDNVENYEYMSLDIKSASNGVSYEVKKGSIVNIYYTTKAKTIDTILDTKEKIYSSSNLDSNVTCKLLEKVEIFGVHSNKGDTYSDDVKENSYANRTFDTVVIRVKEVDALLISNLKEQGTFNVTIVNQ